MTKRQELHVYLWELGKGYPAQLDERVAADSDSWELVVAAEEEARTQGNAIVFLAPYAGKRGKSLAGGCRVAALYDDVLRAMTKECGNAFTVFCGDELWTQIMVIEHLAEGSTRSLQ